MLAALGSARRCAFELPAPTQDADPHTLRSAKLDFPDNAHHQLTRCASQ